MTLSFAAGELLLKNVICLVMTDHDFHDFIALAAQDTDITAWRAHIYLDSHYTHTRANVCLLHWTLLISIPPKQFHKLKQFDLSIVVSSHIACLRSKSKVLIAMYNKV